MSRIGIRSPLYFRNRSLNKQVLNEFNKTFLWGSIGGKALDDDLNQSDYIDFAYNINPDVFSVVNQISNKFNSIPYYIKDIKDKESLTKLRNLNNATKYEYSLPQTVKSIELKDKAYTDEYISMPLDNPNPNQTWGEFWKLSETFLQTNGNVYWYILKPQLRDNAEPLAIYVLPSHLMEIVLKPKADLLTIENPIDHYMLIEGAQYTKFDVEDVVHIKYPNPNYDQNGSHLYGQSPLRAAYKNITATNKGLDLAVNNLKNGGAFGFIHAKDGNTPLTSEQASSIKDRLNEMDKSTEDLGRIAGASTALAFTRLSLTTDELKPFDYFSYNLKQICNVLGWDDKLMNSDSGAKYDNYKVAEKRVVSNKIVSDIKIFEQQFNDKILPLFKGYENTCIYWDVKELPEMQQDYKTMVDWIKEAVNIGLITRNQGLKAMGMPVSEDSNMDLITVVNDVMTLEDSLMPNNDLQI